MLQSLVLSESLAGVVPHPVLQGPLGGRGEGVVPGGPRVVAQGARVAVLQSARVVTHSSSSSSSWWVARVGRGSDVFDALVLTTPGVVILLGGTVAGLPVMMSLGVGCQAHPEIISTQLNTMKNYTNYPENF